MNTTVPEQEPERSVDPKRSIPEISVDSMILYKRLAKAEPGEVIPYDELSELIKTDVRGKGYGYLSTARNRARSNDMMVFEAVRGEGLRRVPNHAICDVSEDCMGRARRQVRKGLKILVCADYDKLDDPGRHKHNVMAATLGAINLVTSPAKRREVDAKIGAAAIPTAETIKLFAD